MSPRYNILFISHTVKQLNLNLRNEKLHHESWQRVRASRSLEGVDGACSQTQMKSIKVKPAVNTEVQHYESDQKSRHVAAERCSGMRQTAARAYQAREGLVGVLHLVGCSWLPTGGGQKRRSATCRGPR